MQLIAAIIDPTKTGVCNTNFCVVGTVGDMCLDQELLASQAAQLLGVDTIYSNNVLSKTIRSNDEARTWIALLRKSHTTE